jgi:molybdopterin molybdotransferase
VEVTVVEGIHERAGRRNYVRAHVELQDGRFIAHTTGKQGSHMLTSLRNANALVIVPEGSPGIQPGGTTPAIMLKWPEVAYNQPIQPATDTPNEQA